MTDHNFDDGILRRLSELPRITQRPGRTEVVRARYHAALERRHRAIERRESARRVLEPVLFGGFSLIYILAVVYDVLQWR